MLDEDADFIPVAEDIVERVCAMAVPRDKCILPGGQLILSGEN